MNCSSCSGCQPNAATFWAIAPQALLAFHVNGASVNAHLAEQLLLPTEASPVCLYQVASD
ncbi:hypothetical protein H6F76_13990 [Leptolyngbya sp. FACHB-321]|uniref:hypothetical protein n=1 Tax=Leptolyngbya sp. FACHB-321 TaxID=2692807 RepID=UPI001683AABC|nr:hypothetical protein [Leptolyngbya sp. FACHB-321]MBD2036131.1 hypothetical protein [Leptolyngbya sp. FACHB-321]